MSVILLALGSLIVAMGIVTIAFGISIRDPGLGNALIIAGTTALSAGAVLIGLAAAVDQLSQIAQALRPRPGVRPAARPAAPTAPAVARPVAPARNPIVAKPNAPERVPEPLAGAPGAPAALGAPAPGAPAALGAGAPAQGAPAPEFSASAIERLRSSLVRSDRKAAEDVPLSPGAAVPAAQAGAGANGAAPSGEVTAVEVLKKPRLDFLFRSKSRDSQSESFDSVWPKRGPRPADEQPNSDESGKPAAREAPLPIERPWPQGATPAPAAEESRPAAILKSGVVDGMAYTLYVDGSIEAQLPQGTVRFGSIAELRAHIENNS